VKLLRATRQIQPKWGTLINLVSWSLAPSRADIGPSIRTGMRGAMTGIERRSRRRIGDDQERIKKLFVLGVMERAQPDPCFGHSSSAHDRLFNCDRCSTSLTSQTVRARSGRGDVPIASYGLVLARRGPWA